jgi:hypothetical protein
MLIRIFVTLNEKGGLSTDVQIIQKVLRQVKLRMSDRTDWQYDVVDGQTWQPTDGTIADVNIHMEIPIRMGMPWARCNVAVVNAEWWQLHDWDWTLEKPASGGMDLFFFKSGHVPALFPELDTKRYVVSPWATLMQSEFGDWSTKESRCLYLLSESVSKEEAALDVVSWWQPEWPPLEIWCSTKFAEKARSLAIPGAPIEWQTEYKSKEEKEARQRACKCHVVATVAEGFGLSMAEAVACGVPIIWSGLPVFEYAWGLKHGRIAVTERPRGNFRDVRRGFTAAALSDAVNSVFEMSDDDVAVMQVQMKARIKQNQEQLVDAWARVMRLVQKSKDVVPRIPRQMPKGAQPPKVAVITVTRNRTAWWPNMVQNIVTQAWPLSHLEWIIVDDGDEGQRLDSRVVKLREERPALTIRYVGLPSGQTIGAKRNAGVAAASADASVFMMMDDDDHYPGSSVSTRASWLTVPGVRVAYCSTIYMYDIPRYISAINTPPMKDSPAVRVSEASLAFTRAGFRPFPDVSMAEGEAFMVGRWAESIEVPPAGVIVSFIHKGNTSSRRIPKEQEPNGSHYGFSDDYFRWLFSVGA